MQKILFYKMSASGNDFILIDDRNKGLDSEGLRPFVQQVCRRRFSVGADGLILIESSTRAHFKWRFFNADGSEAEMCGNGGRCVAKLAHLLGIAPAQLSFETQAGIIQADVPMNKDIDRMSLDELLLVLLGRNRLESAKGIPDALVSVDKETRTLLSGSVKDYGVRIDTKERLLEHDCVDFKTNRAAARLFCKHLGAFVRRVDPARGVHLLRELLRERDHWTFG